MRKKITIKITLPLDKYEASKREGTSYNGFTGKLSFYANCSTLKLSWRLVYWNGKVKDLFESEGITHTINYLFCGTEKECLAEIKRLNLKYDPELMEKNPREIRGA